MKILLWNLGRYTSEKQVSLVITRESDFTHHQVSFGIAGEADFNEIRERKM